MDLPAIPCANCSVGTANQLLGLIFQAVLTAQCNLSPPELWPEDYGPRILKRGFEDQYDFIIVGAGSAGSVVASRLSENPACKVLLLEAGGDPPIESEIPALTGALLQTRFDWNNYAELSDKASLSFPKGSYYAEGKMLGGSGAHNEMVYIRGNRRDYDRWEALGNPGWGWEDVLEYFKKSEGNKNDEIADQYGGKFHNKSGPINVELYAETEPLRLEILKAAQELGYKHLLDFNAKEHIGFGFAQGTICNNRRMSTAKAFLVPAKNRPNLHVVKYAHVLKLKFNHQKKLSGVEINLAKQKVVVAQARKEIIISAGSLHTPQILMLSGIGPRHHLKEKGIPLIKNAAVGKNLQDHVGVTLFLKISDFNEIPSSAEALGIALYMYLIQNTGPLTSIGILDTMGFVNTKNDSVFPNIQYHHMYFTKNAPQIRTAVNTLGYDKIIQETLVNENREGGLLLVIVTLINPLSRGTIELRGSDPAYLPKIDPNILDRYEDVETIYEGVQTYLKMLNTKAFRDIGVNLIKLPLSECDKYNYGKFKYLECYIRHLSSTFFHPVGTAKIGPDSDPEAVLDARLKVKGVKGLRVVDASIMPLISSGNTNAPTIMIAEKASDMIKEDWKMV